MSRRTPLLSPPLHRHLAAFATLAALLLPSLAGTAIAGEVATRDLEHRLVKLSYANAETSLNALKLLGYTTVEAKSEATTTRASNNGGMNGGMASGAGGFYPPNYGAMGGGSYGAPPAEPQVLKRSYGVDELPIIVRLPGPDASQSGLVGADAAVARGDLGISMIPNAATPLASDTVAAEGSQLLVLYQAERPEQWQRVIKLLDQVVDVPARQILVEGMVLEVSRDGLDQLGVEWFEQRDNRSLRLGSLGVGNGNTLAMGKDTTASPLNSFVGKVQALVQSGKAEILSRPSVLTLDNRQATIRVGTDIPIATSKDASSAAEARVSFSFQYLPTGILLNVRPRANREGQEVSMLIDTTVSSTVTGKDLEVKSAGGAVLASAPTIATRRVQTYARIANNTPLIIGGLVSRDTVSSRDSVPLLGDIPLVGKLFGAEKSVNAKREVIIVLTPTIMGEQFSASRVQPKDDEAFDSSGNDLFRDSYRLKAEDVIDSRYIRANHRLLGYRARLQAAVARDAALGRHPLVRRLAGHNVPGEEILIAQMMYELLARQNAGDGIALDRIQFFGRDDKGEFEIRTLAQVLGGVGAMDGHGAFAGHPGQALALSFVSQRNGRADGSALAEPRATVSWVPCKDRNEWSRTLWELNQPLADGKERYSILLQNGDDLRRLARVIALKRLFSANGGESHATLGNYAVGRIVTIPEIQKSQNHLLEATVARHFFHSRHAFPAFDAEQAQVFERVDRLLDGGPSPARENDPFPDSH